MTGKEKVTHLRKMIGKKLRKIIKQLLLMFCLLKKYLAYVSKYNSNR